MNHLELPGLQGQNTLGVLVLVNEAGLNPELSWTDDINQSAVLSVNKSHAELEEILLRELERVELGVLLNGTIGKTHADVKFVPNDTRTSELRRWTAELRASGTQLERRLLGALSAEGAIARTTKAAKPTNLHFVSGNQHFLSIAREVLAAVREEPERIKEALQGPWRFDGQAKNFRWASGTQRVFAHRGFNPTNPDQKLLGVPAADALAFVGLSMLPVVEAYGSLRTTGCVGGWNSSSFRWALWDSPLSIRVVQSVLAIPAPQGTDARQRGITEVLKAPVHRPDGKYGNFGAPQMNL
jgi:hypothetical protein